MGRSLRTFCKTCGIVIEHVILWVVSLCQTIGDFAYVKCGIDFVNLSLMTSHMPCHLLPKESKGAVAKDPLISFIQVWKAIRNPKVSDPPLRPSFAWRLLKPATHGP